MFLQGHSHLSSTTLGAEGRFTTFINPRFAVLLCEVVAFATTAWVGPRRAQSQWSQLSLLQNGNRNSPCPGRSRNAACSHLNLIWGIDRLKTNARDLIYSRNVVNCFPLPPCATKASLRTRVPWRSCLVPRWENSCLLLFFSPFVHLEVSFVVCRKSHFYFAHTGSRLTVL